MKSSEQWKRLAMLGVCFAAAGATDARAGAAVDDAVTFSKSEVHRILRHSPLPAVPDDPTNFVADDPRAVQLGQFLFFDERLSANGRSSCASCHQPQHGFADDKPLSEGIGRGTRHVPTIWNVAYNRWYFWDGRADTLWAQAVEPLENPIEMGSDRLHLAHLIAHDDALRLAYTRLFGPLPDLDDESRFPAHARPIADEPDHPQEVAWRSMAAADQEAATRILVNVAKAIAAYERRIVSRHSAFDNFAVGLADGDKEKLAALSVSAQRGLKIFINEGNCRFCHVGPNFSDSEFHDIRVPPGVGLAPSDPGRLVGVQRLLDNPFNAAGAYSDDTGGASAALLSHIAPRPEFVRQFKTPTLRNVARTAPYMHHGQMATLGDVVHYYSTMEGALPPGHHKQEQILAPLALTEAEEADLVAFLESLTDEAIDPALLRRPGSPDGTAGGAQVASPAAGR